MEDKIDCKYIIESLRVAVENKKAQFDPEFWLDAGNKLNILLPDEHDKLFNMQQKIAQMKLGILTAQEKRNVSEANLTIEAEDKYKYMRIQEAFVKVVEEFIRLSKLRAKLAGNF